jgi:drug/metabolite transporter superfamily protein YnfA
MNTMLKDFINSWWIFYYFFNIVGDFGRQKRPVKFEIIGSMVAVLGAVIIFYAPR